MIGGLWGGGLWGGCGGGLMGWGGGLLWGGGNKTYQASADYPTPSSPPHSPIGCSSKVHCKKRLYFLRCLNNLIMPYQKSFLKGFIKGLLRLCSILGKFIFAKNTYDTNFCEKSSTVSKHMVSSKPLTVLQKIPPEKVVVNKSTVEEQTFLEEHFPHSLSFVFYLKNKNHHTLFSNHTSIWSRVGVTNQSCESE
jgi:hypothetical protein